jgi:RNA polymerase sigma-70 factor (ECF subfamily)
MSLRSSESSGAVAERAARTSYGGLLARLAVRWRDVGAAEDALSEAFVAALERWPEDGVPDNPEAWLLIVARRKLSDHARSLAVRGREDLAEHVRIALDPATVRDEPDDRLRLMLVCAHPSIDPAIQPALILQTVLGIAVKDMAGAFLLSHETLNKRLVRAKAKIKATQLRFDQPSPEDLEPRVHALLEAIYAAYAIGQERAVEDGDANDRLRAEAVYLAQLVAASLPSSPEALGFVAMLLFCEARRAAGVDASGEFVPLLEQDPAGWDAAILRSAQQHLARAAAFGALGPFQLEAAIQAAHCYRARTGVTPWSEITALYRTLVTLHPTIGAQLGYAVATAHSTEDPAQGLAILENIDPARVAEHQPYWVARGHILAQARRTHESIDCLRRGLGLTTSPRLQRHLAAKLSRLKSLASQTLTP